MASSLDVRGADAGVLREEEARLLVEELRGMAL